MSPFSRLPFLEVGAAVGLSAALVWAVLSAVRVVVLGPTLDDLAHVPEASLTFPGAQLVRDASSEATLGIVFSGTPAHFGREYRTAASFTDVVGFYRYELPSRGWMLLLGLRDVDACARGLQFSLTRSGPTTFVTEIYQFRFRFPERCAQGAPPPPEVVALAAIVAFTAYITRVSLLQRRARRIRGDPLLAVQGVARWGPAFAWVPYVILDARPGPTIAPSELIVDVGLALIIAGAAFALWAAATLGAQFDLEPEVHRGHTVVRRGPYRFVRHPVYLGLGVHLIGGGVASGNLVLVLGVLLVGLPLLYTRARGEERLLRAELGPAYDAYAREVGMFVPLLGRGG